MNSVKGVATVDSFPLSPIQQGMLFHYLSGEHAGVDIEQIVCRFEEELDVDAFRQAWQQVVEHHPVLRARFRWDGLDQPLQDICKSVELPFDVQDWQNVSGEEQQVRLTDLVARDRAAGFDLEKPPLVRLTFIKTAAQEFRLVWTFHHMLMDGRSFPLVLRDVFSCYDARVKGVSANLNAPPPYRGHIEWLHARDESGDEKFWRDLLADVNGATPLPVESEADEHVSPGYDRGERQLRLDAGVTASLAAMAKSHSVTLNTVLQAAWAILLQRYTSEQQIVFGATRAGRHTIAGANDVAGMFINTLPVSVAVLPETTPVDLMKALREQEIAVRPFEHTSLADIQTWSNLSAGSALFDTLIVFDRAALDTVMKGTGDAWKNRHFRLLDKTNLPLTIYGYGEEQLFLNLVYDKNRLADTAVEALVGHLEVLLSGIAQAPDKAISSLTLLTKRERSQQVVDWNQTTKHFPKDARIHDLIARQSAATPNHIAVAAAGKELSYREMDEQANQLARHLQALGVGPDVLVGIHIGRSTDMLVGLLAILKAGGAYLPLDPEFPADRLAFMLEDAKAPVLLTEAKLRGNLPDGDFKIVEIDTDRASFEHQPVTAPADTSMPDSLSYVIYTSGSTGRPKGVMIEHRNVVNFFAGMDDAIDRGDNDAWLAVTSLSFDISVLELLWTLARGFTVVLAASFGDEAQADAATFSSKIDFSLFYFASDDGGHGRDKYRLLLEGAKFADTHGFSAVWTPERHFHAFGGIFPNPAVAGAAVAAVTKNIQIRAGSCVLPLHNPIRVAEEWALVDNLCNGGVGIAFAAGWQPNDFVLAPQNYADRKDLMFREIETVRKLWRGEKVKFPNAKGDLVEIETMPRPVQPELPVWVTTAGSVETYIGAGKAGANVLTHLLGQAVSELGEKIAAYRKAWKEAGHPGEGSVTLMLHTFVGDDEEKVREIVRQPMKNYLSSAISLVKGFADSWTAYKQGAAAGATVESSAIENLSEEEMDSLLDFAFERFFETSSFFGTQEKCLKLAQSVQAAGVDEIACLIDFGVDHDLVLEQLNKLNEVREAAQPKAGAQTLPEQIRSYGITHLQCTPSMARMLLLNDEARNALKHVRHVLLGGEALPAELAREVQSVSDATITNMYGPTETTIWSSCHRYDRRDTAGTVAIGRPIANTSLYVLDASLEPVPTGIVGELYIGGEGVVRGYLDRPELNAERFVPDPFSDIKDARLYRTGDLVRYRNDGIIDFVGRIDHQVKVRGYRVELGEIEAAMMELPEVSAAVVMAREDVPGDKRLVAYLIAKSPVETASLRAHLGERLPDYMVPSNFITLDSFPQTPNHKVDRKALPAPSEVAVQREAAFTPPTNDIEKQVAELWAQVLNLPEISTRDNFFDLGGHSILAVKLHGQLRKLTDRKLLVTDIFKYPTIRAYAEFLGGESDEGKDVEQSMERGASRRAAMSRRRGRRTTGDVS